MLPKNSFDEFSNQVFQAHTVGGRQRWGAIFDPGAPDGLCGTETLRQYANEVLSPSGQNFITIEKRTESYSGIEGAGIPSRLRVEIPMDFGSLKYNFVSDTVGGSGDRCPFLFPNSHCLQQQTITFHAFFENGDGLLLFPRLKIAVCF